MADAAHEWTDGQIDELRERLRRTYASAEREMRERLAWFMRSYDMQNERWKKQVASGQATEEEYRNWRRDMATDRAFLGGMVNRLAEDAVNVDRMAIGMVNDSLPQVYSENANMAAYEVEMGIGKNTHSFDLVDESTIRVLMQDPDLLPEVRQPRFDNGVDLRWNRQKFTGAITQSILQGESIPRAADRLSRVMRMNEGSAVRAARTAITSAENAGRISSYKRAEAIGIKLEQQWVATLDSRTRHSHRMVDGQHVPVGEMFDVDGQPMEYPGDPNAPGEYVYNCRCTLVAWFPDIEQEDPERWSDLPAGMTYDEWKDEKSTAPDGTEFVMVDGQNILSTWRRRPDEFDFEIEDVINAQGFDGLPRVVSQDEFDAAVMDANGGNGLVMQRAYKAPSQEVLDSYREQLYNGTFYVECSGGAAYGQGMYAAGNMNGIVNERLRGEMQFYSNGRFSYIETMTLDNSANIVMFNDVNAEKRSYYKEERERRNRELAQRIVDEFSAVPRGKANRQEFIEYVNEELDNGYSFRDPHVRSQAARSELDIMVRDARKEAEEGQMDTGAFAAASGYDAILSDDTDDPYIVVLNRTKLIIREPE